MSPKFKLWVLLVLIVFLLFFVVASIYKHIERKNFHRLYETEMAMCAIRGNLDIFKKKENRFPHNLDELIKNVEMHPELDFNTRIFKEYISCKEGNGKEYSTLNGHGGWYYNNKTGEVKVNLNKPIKKYLNLFFVQSRNQVPSEW